MRQIRDFLRDPQFHEHLLAQYEERRIGSYWGYLRKLRREQRARESDP